jgi:elongation factor 1-alpha
MALGEYPNMSLPKTNLVFVGHKDHGKSTLIGRLLYDSKAIFEQKLQQIRNELKESGSGEFEFAFLLDSLEEERKGGLTIDIMQTPFKSEKHFYTIIDCPGHREFIEKMLTGASQADAAVLVVSAKEGIQDQTRQHAFLIKTLGINQLVVAVNKMDTAGYEMSRFHEISEKVKQILASLGYTNTPMVPISAMKGDNVYSKSKKMGWYKGSTLIGTLDNSISPSDFPVNKPLRGFVQDVYQNDGKELIVCKIETGLLEPGNEVIFNPSGNRGLLKTIEVFGTKAIKAEPGDSVGLVVEGINNIRRGEIVSLLTNQPRRAKSFIAEIILFSGTELKRDESLLVRVGTAEMKCKIKRILREIDPVNLTIRAEHPNLLKDGSVGEVELLPLQPLCIEKYSDFPQLGRFVVEGGKGTAAAGIVLEVIA